MCLYSYFRKGHGPMNLVRIPNSDLPNRRFMWLVVHWNGLYWPQARSISPQYSEEAQTWRWRAQVTIETSEEGSGERYDLMIFLVDANGHQLFNDRAKIPMNGFPGMEEQDLPPNPTVLDSIRVIRSGTGKAC